MHICSYLTADVFLQLHYIDNCWTLILDLEEKAKQDEMEEKQKMNNPAETQSSDTSEIGNNTKTQDKDKNNTDSSEKLQDKRQDKSTKEKDSKTQDNNATLDDAEPAELQPREQEGNKDPGGANEARTPGSDAKEPDTSSDTDNSQRAHNGEWQEALSNYDPLKLLHKFYYKVGLHDKLSTTLLQASSGIFMIIKYT